MSNINQNPDEQCRDSSTGISHVRPRSDSTPAGRASKYIHLETLGESSSPHSTTVLCSLPPHQPMNFESFEDYEIHYNQNHVNRCVACQKNFPTAHFLELHLAENHDPINEAKKERGEKIVMPRLT